VKRVVLQRLGKRVASTHILISLFVFLKRGCAKATESPSHQQPSCPLQWHDIMKTDSQVHDKSG